MFNITVDDVTAVYEQLKDRYDLVLTTTSALDEGFTVDCPIIVGKAHGQIIELYEDGGDFVLDVMDEEQTKGTHWHPNDVKGAVDCIEEFMEGKSDYEMYPFGQAKGLWIRYCIRISNLPSFLLRKTTENIKKSPDSGSTGSGDWGYRSGNLML